MAAVLLLVRYPTLPLIPGIEWTWAVYGLYSYSSYFFSLYFPPSISLICLLDWIHFSDGLSGPIWIMYLTICNAMHGT